MTLSDLVFNSFNSDTPKRFLFLIRLHILLCEFHNYSLLSKIDSRGAQKFISIMFSEKKIFIVTMKNNLTIFYCRLKNYCSNNQPGSWFISTSLTLTSFTIQSGNMWLNKFGFRDYSSNFNWVNSWAKLTFLNLRVSKLRGVEKRYRNKSFLEFW